MVQNFHGVKLSVFTHGVKLSAVSNCPFLPMVSNCPRCQIVLVSNCPVSNCPRCQIVRCQIVLVSNCPPTWAVSNCPGVKLSRDQNSDIKTCKTYMLHNRKIRTENICWQNFFYLTHVSNSEQNVI